MEDERISVSQQYELNVILSDWRMEKIKMNLLKNSWVVHIDGENDFSFRNQVTLSFWCPANNKTLLVSNTDKKSLDYSYKITHFAQMGLAF